MRILGRNIQGVAGVANEHAYVTKPKEERPREKIVDLTCAECAGAFQAPKRRKYCGEDCERIAHARAMTKPRVEVQCEKCNLSFFARENDVKRGRRFCSTTCKNDTQSASFKAARERVKCKRCKKLFYVPKGKYQRYCSRECVHNKIKKEKALST